MNEYFFQQRINTIAHLRQPFDFRGFRFEAHAINTGEGTEKGWIASKTITASDVQLAYSQVVSELHPIVDRISFVTQCFSVVAHEPFLLKRPDRSEFFLQFSQNRQPVSLIFGADEIESLNSLDEYEEKGDAFRYLREAINAPDFYARFAMLASCLEGIAGELGKNKTNHGYIKDVILNDAGLHKKIFGSGSGIRNQLLHGKKIDNELHGDTPYVQIIYDKIVSYFNQNYGTKINTEVKNAPRTIGMNYNMWRGWLVPISKQNQSKIELSTFLNLDLHEATKDFVSINSPDDY